LRQEALHGVWNCGLDPLRCLSFQGTLQLNSRPYKMTTSTETYTNLQKTRRGLDRLLHATGFSAAGLRHGWSEPAFRFESILALVMLPGSIWLGRTWVETAVLAGTVLLVLIVELLNTAIEVTIDRISAEWHELSGRAKDLGSAAVFLSLLLTAGIWLAAIASRLA
jgi:diacylglycerol kinase (ATP)